MKRLAVFVLAAMLFCGGVAVHAEAVTKQPSNAQAKAVPYVVMIEKAELITTGKIIEDPELVKTIERLTAALIPDRKGKQYMSAGGTIIALTIGNDGNVKRFSFNGDEICGDTTDNSPPVWYRLTKVPFNQLQKILADPKLPSTTGVYARKVSKEYKTLAHYFIQDEKKRKELQTLLYSLESCTQKEFLKMPSVNKKKTAESIEIEFWDDTGFHSLDIEKGYAIDTVAIDPEDPARGGRYYKCSARTQRLLIMVSMPSRKKERKKRTGRVISRPVRFFANLLKVQQQFIYGFL